MAKARTALETEVDIVKLIKSNRFIHLALKHLLDPQLLKELKSRSKFKDVEMAELDADESSITVVKKQVKRRG